SSDHPTAAFGELVTLTTRVQVTQPGAGTPTGTVTLLDGTTLLGTIPLGAGGQAILTTGALAPSSSPHRITATYSGDTTCAASTPPALAQAINPASTTIQVTSDRAVANAGEAVLFTARVQVTAPGAGRPSGMVTFLDGNTVLGVAPLDGFGQAVLATTAL